MLRGAICAVDAERSEPSVLPAHKNSIVLSWLRSKDSFEAFEPSSLEMFGA